MLRKESAHADLLAAPDDISGSAQAERHSLGAASGLLASGHGPEVASTTAEPEPSEFGKCTLV
jgi:hypothetical protein